MDSVVCKRAKFRNLGLLHELHTHTIRVIIDQLPDSTKGTQKVPQVPKKYFRYLKYLLVSLDTKS